MEKEEEEEEMVKDQVTEEEEMDNIKVTIINTTKDQICVEHTRLTKKKKLKILKVITNLKFNL